MASGAEWDPSRTSRKQSVSLAYAPVIDARQALTGMKHIDLPATREKLWRALRAA
jgi:hypothetical protein